MNYFDLRKGINHNIDELLVGTFTQITLKMKQNWVKDDSLNKVQILFMKGYSERLNLLLNRYKIFSGTC